MNGSIVPPPPGGSYGRNNNNNNNTNGEGGGGGGVIPMTMMGSSNNNDHTHHNDGSDATTTTNMMMMGGGGGTAPTTTTNETNTTNTNTTNLGNLERLVEKEREVAQRMQILKERQQSVAAALASLQPNWPPHCLCVGPIVYHDIDMAVPEERKRFAKFSYYNFFFTMVILVYNLVVSVAALAAKTQEGTEKSEVSTMGQHMGMAVPILLLGAPGAFLVWHFQLYKAIQPQNQRVRNRFGLAFLGLGIALLFDILQAVGIPGYGGCGWVYALWLRDRKNSSAPMYMCIASAILWTLQALSFLWMFLKLRWYYKADSPASSKK